MEAVLVGLLVLVVGGILTLGAIKGSGFVLNSRRARLFVTLFGRQGARILYSIIGGLVMLVGLVLLVGGLLAGLRGGALIPGQVECPVADYAVMPPRANYTRASVHSEELTREQFYALEWGPAPESADCDVSDLLGSLLDAEPNLTPGWLVIQHYQSLSAIVGEVVEVDDTGWTVITFDPRG